MLFAGDRELALEWTARAAALRPDDQTTMYNCACLYTRAGQHDRALDCLEGAIVGHGLREWVEHDSDLDPLREFPRFKELLTRMSWILGARKAPFSARNRRGRSGPVP